MGRSDLRATPEPLIPPASPVPHGPVAPAPVHATVQGSVGAPPRADIPVPPPAPKVNGKPDPCLWLAIVMLVVCCSVPAIVAIVYGSQCNSRWSMGDADGARRACRKAHGWIIASFVLGLLSATIYYPLYLLTSSI